MKSLNTIPILLIFFLETIITSCSSINEIYTAGIGYGIFTALAVIVLIVFFLKKLNRK